MPNDPLYNQAPRRRGQGVRRKDVDLSGSPCHATVYLEKVIHSSLLYAALGSPPDICYAVGVMGRFDADPSSQRCSTSHLPGVHASGAKIESTSGWLISGGMSDNVALAQTISRCTEYYGNRAHMEPPPRLGHSLRDLYGRQPVVPDCSGKWFPNASRHLRIKFS
jgi:hypothetical protein